MLGFMDRAWVLTDGGGAWQDGDPSITEGPTDPIAGPEDRLRDQGNNGGLAERGETRERERTKAESEGRRNPVKPMG